MGERSVPQSPDVWEPGQPEPVREPRDHRLDVAGLSQEDFAPLHEIATKKNVVSLSTSDAFVDFDKETNARMKASEAAAQRAAEQALASLSRNSTSPDTAFRDFVEEIGHLPVVDDSSEESAHEFLVRPASGNQQRSEGQQRAA